MSGADLLAPLADAVSRDGFAFVRGAEMRATLARAGSLADGDRFAASWDDLGVDTYMADGGRYRKRRHAVYGVGPDGIRRKPHQAHYQSRDYNKLNGGIARWFEPVLPEIGAGPSMTTVLATCRALFERLTPAPPASPPRARRRSRRGPRRPPGGRAGRRRSLAAAPAGGPGQGGVGNDGAGRVGRLRDDHGARGIVDFHPLLLEPYLEATVELPLHRPAARVGADDLPGQRGAGAVHLVHSP